MSEWKDLTSHQKLLRIPMAGDQPLWDIPLQVGLLRSPFKNAEARYTWRVEANDTGFTLVVHAMRI